MITAAEKENCRRIAVLANDIQNVFIKEMVCVLGQIQKYVPFC